MDALQLTAVLKSDLVGFSDLASRLAPEALRAVLTAHDLAARTAFQAQGGSVVKGEGDAFWAVFPSVTAAVRAAVAMRRALREDLGPQGDGSLRARWVVTVGDVLHEGEDIYGPAVNLAARLEAITPADGIFLSDAAWSCVGDREFRGEVEQSFLPKGFTRPVTVYRVEPRGAARRFRDEVVMFTDLEHYTRFVAEHEHDLELLERVFTTYARLHDEVSKVGGQVSLQMGDVFMLKLLSVAAGIRFFEAFCAAWGEEADRLHLPAEMTVRASLHVGDYAMVGTSAVGTAVNDAAIALESARLSPDGSDHVLVLSDRAHDQVRNTLWHLRLQPVPVTTDRFHGLGETVRELRLPSVRRVHVEADGG